MAQKESREYLLNKNFTAKEERTKRANIRWANRPPRKQRGAAARKLITDYRLNHAYLDELGSILGEDPR